MLEEAQPTIKPRSGKYRTLMKNDETCGTRAVDAGQRCKEEGARQLACKAALGASYLRVANVVRLD